MAKLREMIADNQQSKAEFAEQKQAEREALVQQRTDSVAEITSDPAAYRAYLDLQALNSAVSPGNLALVRAADPEATVVYTMNRWNNLNRNVSRGESGIKVMLPQKYRDGRGVARTGYDVGRMFDVRQTHGARLPPPITLRDGTPEMERAIRALVASAPVPIEPVEGFVDGSHYDPQSKKIFISEDLPDGAQFTALVLETAHAQLHSGYQAEYSRDLCATDAESVAYIVSKRFGVEADPPAAADLDMLYGEVPVTERREALEYIQKLSKTVMERVERELNPVREREYKSQEEHAR